ncbi:hypothetical protein Tco_1302262 [Tanacetum coccineum]
MVQPALYDGDEILKTHHVLVSVTSSEEDLEIAEITRQKMNEKMNDPVCVEKKIKIIPPNYSKENFLATFTPQNQLTPEQVFWSKDLLKQRAEHLKTNAPPLPTLPLATVYPPNTPVHLVPQTLPTISQVNIGLSLVKEVRAMKAVLENMEAEVDQNVIDKKCREIERKNLLLTNENFIANCIAQDVIEQLAARSGMDLKMAKTCYHSHYQIQGHKNTIRKLKAQISQLKANKSDEISSFDYKSLDSQNLQLTKTVTALQEQLEHFKAENEKVKQHYQELFNSIKITRVKTIERTTSLQTEIENLKTQLKGKMPCVTSNVESPKVSVFEKYAIEVELIPPSQRNNRDVHHHYLNRLRDTLDTLREIVKEARSKRPSDHSLDYVCVYTKRSQELLENVSALCPKVRNNTTNHVKHLAIQKTNVPIIHSTRVSNATKARRSQSKSNKMNDKTLPANSVPEKKVEDHHRKNKSKLSKKNRIDSSTSVRRTVFNMNSNSLCKTCAQCPLTRNTKPKVVRVKQWKPTGRLIPLGGQCPLVRLTTLNHGTMPTDPQGNNTPVEYHLVCSNQQDSNCN